MLDIVRNQFAFCSYPFTRFKVTCEGYVTMCCFQERKCLGNLLDHTLEEIWFGPLAEEIRKETLNGELHSTCSATGSCPYHRRFERAQQGFLQHRYPTMFEIDLPAQHCNIGGETPTEKNPACLMCERNWKFPEEFYEEDHLKEICEKLKPYVKNLTGLHVQGVAEPFWKDRIFEILEWLNVEPYKEKIAISTTTNGTLMNEARRRRFLEYPNSSITWSIDASTPEVFKKIRRWDAYDKIVANMKAYAAERKQGQAMMIHNNINLVNIGDVEGMVRLASEVGVDRVDFNPTENVPDICVNADNVHLFRDAQIKIMKEARRLRMYTTFMRDFTLDFEEPPTWQGVGSKISI